MAASIPICSTQVFSAPQDIFANPGSRKVTALRIEGKIVIDGRFDEEEWSLAQPAADFIQNDPDMGESATERTEVRILYDDENLYIGASCFDSQGAEGLVVTEMRRDYGPRENDHFSMVFDTFDDNRNGFIFGVNPSGAQRDGQVGGDGAEISFDWDGIWDVKTSVSEMGWQIEAVIPLTTLRFREVERQVWGVNFGRRIRRKNESTYWSPIPRPHTMSRVSYAGTLEGINGMHQGRNIYIKPYLSTPVVRKEGDDVDVLPEIGLDAKLAVTSNLTLDLTVNTDFAQVEADQQQINLTRFSLFFPEKREFFLENASIFEFGKSMRRFGRESSRDIIPFFSRRIGISEGGLVPILAGARLTGKVGQYTLGFLSIQADDFQETPSTNFTVGRISRELFRNSDVGGIFINKQERDGDFNRTFGVDANFKFFNYLDVVPFVLKTETPGQEGRDMAVNLSVAWNDPFWDIQGEYLDIEENFNPEVGFVPRTGIRKSRGKLGIRPRPGEWIPFIRQFQPFVEMNYITDQQNVLQTRTLSSAVSVQFQNSSNLRIGYVANFERLDEPFEIRDDQEIPIGDYQFNEIGIAYTGDRSRMFSGQAEVRWGDFFKGEKTSYELGLRFQPSRQFNADVSWDHDDITLPSGDFTTDLATTRLLYSFTTKMFLTALIQYNGTVDEIESNIRFNWIYQPLSDLFLVYNERRAIGGEVLERALIAKITYIFDF
ncbi:MAG: DUF5916 domain-containing protein [Acidobacteriota bacterium]